MRSDTPQGVATGYHHGVFDYNAVSPGSARCPCVERRDRGVTGEMQLHTATLSLTLMSVFLLLGVLMAVYGRSARTYPGFGAWTMGFFTYAAAFLLISLRGRASPYLSIVGANVLLAYSAVLIAQGVRRFYGSGRNSGHDILDYALALLLAVLFFWLVQVEESGRLRSLVHSSVVAVIYGRIVLVPARALGHRMRIPDWVLTASLALVALTQILRVYAVGNLPAHAEPVRDDPSMGWNLYVAILLAIFAAIAYLRLMYMRMNDELVEANARLQEMSETDPLTGLAIRRRFDPVARSAFLAARRYRQPLSLLMFDIDHFKRVNDEYGHEAGDRVLADVARTARGIMRDVDLIARIGGEEFLVLFPQTGLPEAKQVAERLVSALDKPNQAGPLPIHVTLSIGIVELEDRDESVASLERRADLALYQAKREGRNRIHCDSSRTG